MKIRIWTAFAFYSFCLKPLLALKTSSGMDFKIFEHTKCFEKENAYLVYSGVSLGQCVTDCGERSNCKVLNYRRMSSLCELFTSAKHRFVKNSQKAGSCVHVRKTDMAITVANTGCSCEGGKVCDTENNYCIAPVCPKLDLKNGELVGNMNEVRARIEYTCDAGYIEIGGQTFSTCQANGEWTYVPSCIIVCPKLDLENGELFGDLNILGARIDYTCDEGYTEIGGQTFSTCQANGEWTHVPSCIIACPKLDLKNGELVGDLNILGARIDYTCYGGYVETGGQTFSTCQANGEWTHVPSCIIDCYEPATYPYSTLSKGLTTENTTRIYACEDFYMMSVDSIIIQTTCKSTGRWTGTDFKCVLDYKYEGCYENNGDNPVLTREFQDGSMTPELCIRRCFSQGKIYAAPEAKEHCLCGDELFHDTKVSEDECDLDCAGDNTLKCGAGWRASVFKKAEGSQYLGCYRDADPDRILIGHSVQNNDQMTTQLCLDLCRSHGHRFAGTEFANECFCGDLLQKVDKRVDNKCNYLCSGNNNLFCGGDGHLSLYTTD